MPQTTPFIIFSSINIKLLTLKPRTTIHQISELYTMIIERNPTLTLIQQHQTSSYRNRFLPSSLLASSRFSLQNQFSSNVLRENVSLPFSFFYFKNISLFFSHPTPLISINFHLIPIKQK